VAEDTRNPEQTHDPLSAALAREAETWKPPPPNVGDEIRGRVIGLGELEGDYGVSPVVTVLTDDDREVRVLGYGTAFRSQIMEANVEVGDYFGARYLGKKMGANGREYHNYRVVALGPDMQPKRHRLVAEPPDDVGVADPGSPPPSLPGLKSPLTPRDDDLEPF
jgi:hypothetical protein